MTWPPIFVVQILGTPTMGGAAAGGEGGGDAAPMIPVLCKAKAPPMPARNATPVAAIMMRNHLTAGEQLLRSLMVRFSASTLLPFM